MQNRINEYTLLRVYLSFMIIASLFLLGSIVRAEETAGVSLLEVTLEANEYSTSDKDIRFKPEVGKEYNFISKISNTGSETIEVKVFPSIAISNNGSIDYVEETPNNLNETYNLQNYVKIYLGKEEITGKTIDINANESTQVRISIKIPTEIQGEVLGGINFAQVLDTQKNENSVDVIQVYQKVVNVRLKMTEFGEKKANTYDEFSFSATKDMTNLDYYLVNNNPFLHYADKGSYKLYNPKEEIISEGEFSTNEVVLTSLSKTRLSVSLKDGTEIIDGNYKFVTIVDNVEQTYEFNYTKKNLEEFAEKNKDKNNVVVNVEGKSSSFTKMFLAFIIIANVLGLLIYFVKRKE